MYHNLKVATLIPAYNEEKLITQTVETLPSFIDKAIVIDDCSTDDTPNIANRLAKKHSNVVVIHNKQNGGIGYSYIQGFKRALKEKADLVVTMAGDAQCNPQYIKAMIDVLIDNELDYVKANRFVHLKDLQQMPRFRRIGNTFITILTKFSSGYYSIFDSQNGYGVLPRATLEALPFESLGKRYDYENTLLIALSIMGARIRDVPVPAVYGEETSSIKVLPTALRALRVTFVGFWKRIYYKYVVYNFHPFALFFLSGLFLTLIGIGVGLYLLFERIFGGISPSSGTVMLVVLPLILGFQLLLTAVILDVNNENR